MKKAISHFITRWRGHHLSADTRRNFRILIAASSLNLSFALEKFTLVLGWALPDLFWMIAYGGLALTLAWIAFRDLAKDTEVIDNL
jgi:hypothetical protein